MHAMLLSIAVAHIRFASGASPAPRWRDARQTTRFLKFQNGGGLGETSPKRVWAAARSRSDIDHVRRRC